MFKEYIENYKKELMDTFNAMDEDILEQIYMSIEIARKGGKQVFVLGNGGSAAAASHWVCDFGKGINVKDSKRLKIYSLMDNMSISSALGNDISYEDVFVEQLNNYLDQGDVVIGLSVSGSSRNLVKALEFARMRNAVTISIIGDYDGIMKKYSDITLLIPSKNYGIVEDIHMSIDHMISQYIKLQNSKKVGLNE